MTYNRGGLRFNYFPDWGTILICLFLQNPYEMYYTKTPACWTLPPM